MAGFGDLSEELIALILECVSNPICYPKTTVAEMVQLYEPPRPPRALRRAALVNRTFSRISRRILFSNVSLYIYRKSWTTGLPALLQRADFRKHMKTLTFDVIPMDHLQEAGILFIKELLNNLPRLETIK